MSLQRRLLLIVLVGAPVVWLLALGFSLWRAQHEINELFDTQQVRLAQQVYAVLPAYAAAPERSSSAGVAPSMPVGPLAPAAPPVPPGPAAGGTELEDLSIAAWDTSGRLLLSDREGIALPFRTDVVGFTNVGDPGVAWRVYYLNPASSSAIVAVGQRLGERDELIRDLLLGQLAPWLLMLLLLLLVLSFGVRKALAPVVTLARDIETRPSTDLRPLSLRHLPTELMPLVAAINRLFVRITESVEHDRRFTADAAHELRTPLAATRAQWEVASAAADPALRRQASSNVNQGLDRMSGLVSQLLALARLDSVSSASFERKIDWNDVVTRALSDVLALADERSIEIDVQWEAEPEATLPLVGSSELITAAIRNLADNAVRYAPAGSRVSIRCNTDAVTVLDTGPGVPEAMLPRLGDRFFRGGGQETLGSGLGLSIVGRIARLHGLALTLGNRPGGGFSASLSRAVRTSL